MQMNVTTAPNGKEQQEDCVPSNLKHPPDAAQFIPPC
jgi:hypothetical protein